MPRPRRFDTAAVDDLLRRGGGVATHAELTALGMPLSTVVRWAAHGPWRRILPGVIVGHRGTPTLAERRRAALAHAGPEAVIGGFHALDLLGVLGDRIPAGHDVLVLVPHTRQPMSTGFVVVERTGRSPEARRRGGLPVTSVARACADASRRCEGDRDRVRELFGAALQQQRCTVEDLRQEVLGGPRQRSAAARAVLLEVTAGVRSAAEGLAHRLVAGADLPQPLWNETVVVDGLRIGSADAYWPELGVALEVDSFRWHLGASAMRGTAAKQRRYAAAGLLLVSITPADLVADPRAFLRTLTETLAAAARRRVS